jgi:TPR repeat protein
MKTLALLICLICTPAVGDMITARQSFQAGQFDQAIAHLIPAANSGNAEAEFLLGNIYALGLGRAVDATRGAEYYLRAATKGHPAAQLRLSRAYETGAGFAAADPLRALLWAKLARIGQAEGAENQLAQLAGAVPDTSPQAVDQMLQDYRAFLFPFDPN